MEFTEYGVEYLRKKLTKKRLRVLKRYQYYEMKNNIEKIGNMIPKSYKSLSETLGWCAKAVDSLADRIVFDSFRNDNFGLNEIYRLNNSDILFDSAVLSALISSCSFIYISANNDYPELQVIDGGNATGIIDTTTNMLTEGYAVLERDEYGKAVLEAYFRPYITEYYINGTINSNLTFHHKSPFALLVPIINRPDAKRPFGHSRISRACMNLTQSALRTLLRSEVSAEFYSVPQKYILGLDEEAAEFNNRAATLSSFLNFSRDDNGNIPSLGQFQQQSMTPHLEQIRTIASVFAGETGLTLDDLGFTSSNPSSSEAIRASHENLRLSARKSQRTFGTGFVNAGFLAACIRDNFEYDRRAFADIRAEWLPVFEPDSAALTGIADAILKINQAVPDFMDARTIRLLTGLESASDDV